MLWKVGQQPKWHRLGEMGMGNAERAKEDAEGSTSSPSMHSCVCITEQELVSLTPSQQAVTNEQAFHLNSSTCILFFRPYSYEKNQLMKSHFPHKIFESCLITSLPPYFLKTVLPASRTWKCKDKVLPKWGMFLGTALQSTYLLTHHHPA